jgi:membrane protein
MKIVDSVTAFLKETIWRERAERRKLVRFLFRLLQVSFLVGKGFLDSKIFLRASALSYTTLLSLVPLLAFVFSILKGLGVDEKVRPLVMEKIAAAQQPVAEKLAEYVTNHIANTSVTALGAVGLVTLLYTVIKVLSTVEASFNDIWGVSQGRTWLRKLSDYTSVMVIAPVLLVVAISVSTYLQANPFFTSGVTVTAWRVVTAILAKLGPYALTWVAFTAFYAFMPNTVVRFGPALGGGIVGGTMWQLAFLAYTKFQVGVANYSMIYTSFAALPVFLMWLYISWVIALFGAEVSFAIANLETYKRHLENFRPSPEAREKVALRVFFEVAYAFHRGQTPPDAERLARVAGIPVRAVRDVITSLVDVGLLSEVRVVKAAGYQPGKDISVVTPAAVLAALRSRGDTIDPAEGDVLWEETLKASGRICGTLEEGQSGRSVAEILGEKA